MKQQHNNVEAREIMTNNAQAAIQTDIVFIKREGQGYLTNFDDKGQPAFGHKTDAMGMSNRASHRKNIPEKQETYRPSLAA